MACGVSLLGVAGVDIAGEDVLVGSTRLRFEAGSVEGVCGWDLEVEVGVDAEARCMNCRRQVWLVYS
jgi:hypothetical protein